MCREGSDRVGGVGQDKGVEGGQVKGFRAAEEKVQMIKRSGG